MAGISAPVVIFQFDARGVFSLSEGKGLASVGLVPGQHSSGGKDRLLGISKRGNAYVRTLLIHGTRAVILHAKDKTDHLSRWLQSLCQRRGKNIASVALANKTMRMAWAMLRSGQDYQPDYGRQTDQMQPA